jgi:YD repeat-containing protein
MIPMSNRIDPYVIPGTPEEFVYDLDGNLISDGRWDYVWDGENRLISMTIRSQVSSEAGREIQDAVRLRFIRTTYSQQTECLCWLLGGFDRGSLPV